MDNIILDPFKNISLGFFSEMELKGQIQHAGYHWVLFSSLFPLELFPVSFPSALSETQSSEGKTYGHKGN